MSATPRTINAIFAFPVALQQRIERLPPATGANNSGGRVQLVLGRGKKTAPFPQSGREQDCRAAAAVASVAGGVSRLGKRHLCDARVTNSEEQREPTANKRTKGETRVPEVAAEAAAAVGNINNRNFSPAPLPMLTTPLMQAPHHHQHNQHHHHGHHHQRILAPVQKTIAPCQATSAPGQHRENMWENWDGEGGRLDGVDGWGEEDGRAERPSSPSMTLWRRDEGDSSPPSVSSSLSPSSPLLRGAAVRPNVKSEEKVPDTVSSSHLQKLQVGVWS